MTQPESPEEPVTPEDSQHARLLDELLSAIQAGDRAKREELLRLDPRLHELVGCLEALDDFIPLRVAPEFQPTLVAVSSQTPSSAGPQPVPQARFGKYELLKELGRGGMGVVYKAWQPDLKRHVALKMILASECASAEQISRFQAEARAAARLRHRNIVGIFEVGEELGRHFFAMDFVEGQSLAAVIARQRPSAEITARWMESIAMAVEHLHSLGIIHRDLKPSNILIDPQGEPMVTDFGLAKMFDSDSGATGTGAILGTPSYMSPEQASGRNALVGVQSDVYSLGAMLYEMLAGRPPFREENPMSTLIQVLEGEPAQLRTLDASIPRELELICLKCLEKDPARRYATAGELAADLHRYLRGEPVEAQSRGLVQWLRRWGRRQPGLACRLAVLIPVLLIIQAYFFVSGTDYSIHFRVTALLALWMGLSVFWQRLLTRERLATASRVGTMLTDAGILTALFTISLLDCGPLVVVYALLIMVSGLWFQERLVWTATAIVELAFLWLLWKTPKLWDPWHFPLLIAITLLTAGAVTGFQVRRVRALSRYYQGRPL